MPALAWITIFVIAFCVLSYNRAARIIWTISFTALIILMTFLGNTSVTTLVIGWILFLAIFVPITISPIRRNLLSRPVLNFYRRVMPSMSRTEREALAAGSVTWEGDLFVGKPRWHHFKKLSKLQLSEEEKAFLEGPVEKLCSMINDWDITHNRTDLPPEMWQYLKEQGFFSLIIPKQYGGKEFSAYAHSQILTKIYSMSSSVATTVSVPNSLGPAELLLHYGTDKQKSYYLPRLASGQEIPCFALTSPDAGSDAGAMPDTGIICWGEHEGKKALGIRLNFNKRYITLAPVATVIGLAFKLYDPEHLLGNTENLGITCALIPRNTPNITIGRRHFPLNTAFLNGPIQGKDVFIPVDWIIGGAEMAGQGWRMLMECLAAGRAISLPSSSTGGTKALAYATGAYARVRKQFNVPIGNFEGVEEALTRIATNTYVVDAARSFAAAAIDRGEKPAIASAIIKYHTTELGRQVANDGMDIHGGKGICLGPNNYIGRGYQTIPIAITVEGANILTRNMIIFGQGAMRCHPYIFAELQAAQIEDYHQSLCAFDKAFMGHIGYSLSNIVRSLFLGLTSGLSVSISRSRVKRYYQIVTRFSAAFALIADVSLIFLGGALKRKESLSARLGDILSYLYLVSSVLKHFADHEEPAADLPLINWICENYFYQIQQKLNELMLNLPNPFVAAGLRLFIFPLGQHFQKPSDKLTHQVAEMILSPTPTRDRITAGIYLTATPNNSLARLQNAFIKAIECEPVEKIIKQAIKEKKINGITLLEQADAAFKQNLISPDQYNLIKEGESSRFSVINVDDFSTEELARNIQKNINDEIILASNIH